MAEQIEIVRVEMVVIAKAIAGVSCSLPAILDSSQAALVERDGSCGLVPLTNDSLVPADKDDEEGDRENQEPGAQHLLPGGQGNQDPQPEHAQSSEAELPIGLRQAVMSGAPLRQARAIGLCGVTVHA